MKVLKRILLKILTPHQYILLKKSFIFIINQFDILIHLPFWSFSIKMEKIIDQKPRIGFAILCHERPEYLEICLNTLFRTKLYDYDVTFLIIDDGSTDTRIQQIINKSRDNKYKIIRKYTNKGNNSWGAAFNKAIRNLFEINEFDIIGTCDSDIIFHPEWLNSTLKIMRWAKENDDKYKIYHFSSYNSSDIDFHRVLETRNSPYGKYHVKRRMGGTNMLMYSNDFKKIGYYEENRDDETLMTRKLSKMGIRYCCTDTSYIEHIGNESILDIWRPNQVKITYGLNLNPKGWGNELETSATLGYYKFVKNNSFGLISRLNVKIDVIIPSIEKDFKTLEYLIMSINKHLFYNIGNIYIISPISNKVLSLVNKYNCIHILEDDLDITAKDKLNYFVNGINRSGWIYQQLIKFSSDIISSQRYLFVIDSDTILTNNQIFHKDSKSILLCSDEYHTPYFKTFEKLFGYKTNSKISFVAHQMLFDRIRLREMKDEIEKKHGISWDKAIVSCLDNNEMSSFSEYETYANWMLKHYPNEISIEYFFNYCSYSKNIKSTISKISLNKRSCSFHTYKN